MTRGHQDPRARPSRSWLFTPATKPERFHRAGEVGADVLIIDLEDSVSPDAKGPARQNALDFLARGAKGSAALAIRINGLGTTFGLADLLAIEQADAKADYLLLPKVEGPDELRLADSILAARRCGTRLVALIESARGLASAAAIAQASPRLAALMFGAADLAADLGAALAWEPLLYGRAHVVAAAASGGLEAIDAPCFDVHNAEVLATELAASLALGFKAKAAIHPGQIGAINAALSPTAQAVEEASRLLVENEKGVGILDGKMIDEAMARRARRTLAKAGLSAAT